MPVLIGPWILWTATLILAGEYGGDDGHRHAYLQHTLRIKSRR